MKVLILGSSGQIGAYLTEYLKVKRITKSVGVDIVDGPQIQPYCYS